MEDEQVSEQQQMVCACGSFISYNGWRQSRWCMERRGAQGCDQACEHFETCWASWHLRVTMERRKEMCAECYNSYCRQSVPGKSKNEEESE